MFASLVERLVERLISKKLGAFIGTLVGGYLACKTLDVDKLKLFLDFALLLGSGYLASQGAPDVVQKILDAIEARRRQLAEKEAAKAP